MFGKDELSIVGRNAEGKGLVPRACEEIFSAIEARQRLNRIDAEVCVSYIEIFGDQVSDLLTHGARCGHSKVASQRYVLSGAAEKTVHTMADVENILRVGRTLCIATIVLHVSVYHQLKTMHILSSDFGLYNDPPYRRATKAPCRHRDE